MTRTDSVNVVDIVDIVVPAIGAITGLTYRPFGGSPSVLELQCTGKVLPGDLNLVSISLYETRNKNKSLASVTLLLNSKCTTSDMFSSCEIDAQNTRNTAVRALLLDLRPGQVREFGCDVTVLVGARSQTLTWQLDVRALRE